MEIGSIAASSTESFNLNYVPEVISFVATTVPTQLKVNVSGKGIICDLDGAGITELSTLRFVGGVTNGYEIRLADGEIRNRTCTITIANAVASALPIYGRSDAIGRAYNVSEQVEALASGTTDIQDFGALAMPALATTDTLTVDYRPVVDAAGVVVQEGIEGEEIALEELEFIAAQTQNSVNGIALIDNAQQRIKRVRARVGTEQTFYTQRIELV